MLEKERIWLCGEFIDLFLVPSNSETRGERDRVKGLCKKPPRFGGVTALFGSTSVENCLRVVDASIVLVEYGLVAIERRLSIGVETR